MARVDAEIYLRRPPGYGLGYTIGNLQIQQLLGELRIRDGEDFDLKTFHDGLLAHGSIPVTLAGELMSPHPPIETSRPIDRPS